MTLPAPPLLLITDRRQARRPLEEIAAAAFAAGCRWLSLREKDLDGAARHALLGRLVALGRPWGACVGVHEDIAAAQAVAAGAVHLPAGSRPAAARAILAKAFIGVSCHDEAAVAAAAAEGADYVTLSPIFVSPSKPGYGPALGLATLARVAERTTLPILALGGVDAAQVQACLAAGAAGVAVMGAVMAAADPGGATAALIEALGRPLAGDSGGHHSSSR